MAPTFDFAVVGLGDFVDIEWEVVGWWDKDSRLRCCEVAQQRCSVAVACKVKHFPSRAVETALECLNLIIQIPDYQHSQIAAAASMDPRGGTDSSSYVGLRGQQERVARLASSASSSSFLGIDQIAAGIGIVGMGTFAVDSLLSAERVGKRLTVSELTQGFDSQSQLAAPSSAG